MKKGVFNNNVHQRSLFDVDKKNGENNVNIDAVDKNISESTNEYIDVDEDIDISADMVKEMIDKEVNIAIKTRINPIKEDYEKNLKHLYNALERTREIFEMSKNKENLDVKENIIVSPEFNYRITNRLKEFMVKNGLDSQIKLADQLDISPKTLSNIINNKFNTSLEIALKLSYIIGVPVNEIFKLEIDSEQ